MSDLIDRSALPTIQIEIPERIDDKTCRILEAVLQGVQHVIDSAPAVDAVEVVRCEDCVHYDNTPYDWVGPRYCECLGCYRQSDFYCAYGKKRKADSNETD